MVKRSIVLIIILVMICLAIGYQAYELNLIRVGVVVGDSKQLTNKISPISSTQSTDTMILAQLASLSLMGEAPREAPRQAEPEKVLETSLNLVLVGTIVSTDQKRSSALVNDGKGTTKRYFIGDTLEGAVLDSVKEGVVVLQRSGKLETLTYPKQTASSPQAVTPAPTPVPNVVSSTPSSPPAADDASTPIKPAALREQRLRAILERKKQQAELQQQPH